MKSGKIITGVLIGAAAGAILGVLFAPDKGLNTRGKIKGGYNDLKDKAKSKWHVFEGKAKGDLTETVNDLISSSSYKAEEVVTFLEEKLAELKKNVKPAK